MKYTERLKSCTLHLTYIFAGFYKLRFFFEILKPSLLKHIILSTLTCVRRICHL